MDIAHSAHWGFLAVSKQDKSISEDQEFAFSKYSKKTEETQVLSDLRAYDLDLKIDQEVSPSYQCTNGSSSKITPTQDRSKAGQIDLSDLTLMREQLNKILQSPDNRLEDHNKPHLSDGSGEISFFAPPADRLFPAPIKTSSLEAEEVLSDFKFRSLENSIPLSDNEKFSKSLNEGWNPSDAELLARTFENEEIFGGQSQQRNKTSEFHSVPTQNKISPSARFSSYSASQEGAGSIAHQSMLTRSNWSQAENLNNQKIESFSRTRSDQTLKGDLDIICQRMNLFLRDILNQSEAHTKQLLNTQSTDFVRQREKIEQKFSTLEDLLKKVNASVEKLGHQENVFSQKFGLAEGEDLKSVILSIDKDLSFVFARKSIPPSNQKKDLSSSKNRDFSPYQHSALQNKDEISIMLENVQRILLRLLDRLDNLSNNNTNGLSQVKNTISSREGKGLFSKLKSLRIPGVPSTKPNGSSSALFPLKFSRLSQRQTSLDVGFQRNSVLTVVALIFVIALSGASLIANSYKYSFSRITSPPQTSSRSNPDTFDHPDQAVLSYVLPSAQKYTSQENYSFENTLPSSVPDEFFGLAISSPGQL